MGGCGSDREPGSGECRTTEESPPGDVMLRRRPLLELLEQGVDGKPTRLCRFVEREQAPEARRQRRPG
jgi:hypothetical protein